MKTVNCSLFYNENWTNAYNLPEYNDLVTDQIIQKGFKNFKISTAQSLGEWLLVSRICKLRMLNSVNNSPMLRLCSQFNLSLESFPLFYRQTIPQFYFKSGKKLLRILLCFTGHYQKLNMPLPLFQNIAWKHYDGIVYFFTNKNNFYIGEELSVSSQIRKLIKLYNIEKIDLVATSGGGPMAMTIEKQIINGQKIIASPPILRVENCAELFRKGDFSFLDKTKIFFASTNSKDSRHFDYIKSIIPPELFNETVHDTCPSYVKHTTLVYAASNCMLDDLMESR